LTQDEIIEMAKQAGMDYLQYISPEAFEKVTAFVKLVAQHEREACAKVCEEQMQGKSIWIEGARACLLAIRARGQA
jgi:tRNA(Leu) C34 or U34 (ribose-2'-O)-methylase TrmL